MSAGSDRIAVPTNGKGPHSIADTSPAPPADPAATGAPTPDDMAMAFSPKQLAIGFGIVASLVVLLLGRARRRGPTDD